MAPSVTSFVIEGFVQLMGGGSVELAPNSGAQNYIIGGKSTATLINDDNDISGTGGIGGLFFTNKGIIETNNNLGAGDIASPFVPVPMLSTVSLLPLPTIVPVVPMKASSELVGTWPKLQLEAVAQFWMPVAVKLFCAMLHSFAHQPVSSAMADPFIQPPLFPSSRAVLALCRRQWAEGSKTSPTIRSPTPLSWDASAGRVRLIDD